MTNLVDHELDTLRRERNEARAQRDALLAALESAFAGLDALLATRGFGAARDQAIGVAKKSREAARAAIREARGETA